MQMRTIPDFEKIHETRKELHKLLRRVVVSTRLGKQHKKPDDDIILDISNGSLGSCGKYEQVRYYPAGYLGEYELDNDLESLHYLLEEVNRRFQEFRQAKDSDKGAYVKGKKNFAKRFFDHPLTKIERMFAH